MTKSIGIIGGGVSGLASAKAALENGYNITIFEKNEALGGIWNPESGQVWSSMHTNISRFTTAFSDTLWDDAIPLFPTAKQVYDYLKNFADKNMLILHTRFNSIVTSIKQLDSSEWNLEINDTKTNKTESHYFDYIIVASGIFSKPYYPDFYKSISKFKGFSFHSKFYNKNREKLKGKKVALIGSSFSASEIAVDLVDYASEIVSIIKKPYYIIPRYIPVDLGNENMKLPLDFVFYSHKSSYSNIQKEKDDLIGSYRSKNQYFNKLCSEQNSVESLKMNSNLNEPPMISISEKYLSNVINNKIKVKQGQVSCFNENCIEFTDGSVENVDAVIVCTGYLASLDFFDDLIKLKLEFEENDKLQPILLYKCTFHPELRNIAFVGLYRGPYFGVIELQARWAVSVFKGINQLPSEKIMWDGINDERRIRNQFPRPQFPHSYVDLANSIAEEIKALPDFDSIKVSDPELYKRIWEGVTIPAHYRINQDKQFALNQINKLEAVIEHLKQNKQ